MKQPLALPPGGLLTTPLEAAEDAAHRYASLALAPRTRAAYAAAWRAFVSWCSPLGLEALPAVPATVAAYIAHQADEGLAPASIDLALAAISAAHDFAGMESPRSSPEVRLVRNGLRRELGTAQRQARALTPAQLRALIAECCPRDRALLLLGFATALRRSELVALDVADVRFVEEGLEVTVCRSKTDQEGHGRVVAVHRGGRAETCPVRALRAWLGERADGPHERADGPLFVSAAGLRLSDRDVVRILKRAAERAGLDASELSGHSLRRGAATAAARAGTARPDICALTGHKPTGRMVDTYIEAGQRFARNPLAGVL